MGERSATQTLVELRRAEERIVALERRALAAERRAAIDKQRVSSLERQVNLPPKPQRKRRPQYGLIIEHEGPAGICRVCAAPAAPPNGNRYDELRVCTDDACRTEARRRDSVTKQRRYYERRSAKHVNAGFGE